MSEKNSEISSGRKLRPFIVALGTVLGCLGRVEHSEGRFFCSIEF
jgi:hypothetical protein